MEIASRNPVWSAAAAAMCRVHVHSCRCVWSPYTTAGPGDCYWAPQVVRLTGLMLSTYEHPINTVLDTYPIETALYSCRQLALVHCAAVLLPRYTCKCCVVPVRVQL